MFYADEMTRICKQCVTMLKTIMFFTQYIMIFQAFNDGEVHYSEFGKQVEIVNSWLFLHCLFNILSGYTLVLVSKFLAFTCIFRWASISWFQAVSESLSNTYIF